MNDNIITNEADRITDEEVAKAVMGALTNSKAYQCYMRSTNALAEKCKEYADRKIKELEKFIVTKCINEGWLGANQTLDYKKEYTMGETGYLTDSEIKYMKNYFENQGFQVSHKMNYKEMKGLFGRVISREPIEVVISVNWDFSKYKENNNDAK